MAWSSAVALALRDTTRLGSYRVYEENVCACMTASMTYINLYCMSTQYTLYLQSACNIEYIQREDKKMEHYVFGMVQPPLMCLGMARPPSSIESNQEGFHYEMFQGRFPDPFQFSVTTCWKGHTNQLRSLPAGEKTTPPTLEVDAV